MEYAFHYYNTLAETGILMALNEFIGSGQEPPVILCIGSDLAIGDSLGPITGTLLHREHLPMNAYVYGTLRSPITAKEVKYVQEFLRKTHPNSKIIAIDAAVGEDNDVGLIKVTNGYLRPGAGAKKRLGKVGDLSILGIVAKKSTFSYALLNLTRLNMIYSMADVIANALNEYLHEFHGANFTKSARN